MPPPLFSPPPHPISLTAKRPQAAIYNQIFLTLAQMDAPASRGSDNGVSSCDILVNEDMNLNDINALKKKKKNSRAQAAELSGIH